MMTSNDGRNIVLAHNGSGYDTRLIFEAFLTVIPPETPTITSISINIHRNLDQYLGLADY